ncbi:MAG: PDZ domain-containing protein, partial [Hyphomicrobium sp.]
EAKGALVDEPQGNGPASEAGLKPQDVIVSVNDHRIKDGRDLARTIASIAPGESIKISYIRNGEEHSVDLKVGRYPDSKSAQNNAPADSDFKLGMTLAPADQVEGAGTRGAVVMNVDPDGTAAEKGIQQGDVILSVGGKAVSGPADVKSALREAKKDSKRAVLMELKTAQGGRFVALPTRQS